MGKIKTSILKKIKIKPAFFLYVVIFFALSLAVSAITIHIVDNFVSTVAVYYINANDDVDRINTDSDEDIQIAVELIDKDFDEVNSDAILFYARNSTVALMLIIYFIAGIIIASHLFFKRKLDIPLRQLEDAAEKISNEDLDFKIEYNGIDEMGKLCQSFEIMRQQLVENNRTMWNMIDEQKRVQRVFSHDIRTPLTVTKGYVDILNEYLPTGKLSQEKTMETIGLIQNNLLRLENFINLMSSMQKLDDIKIKPEKIPVADLFKTIKENASMICWDKRFKFESSSDAEYANLDKNIIEQIIANLCSNASRYAKDEVIVECEYKNEKLKINVKDDGVGFSREALAHALEPYFTEENKNSTDHFGIGLNVCKILCHKLGGKISCSNNNGAQIVVEI